MSQAREQESMKVMVFISLLLAAGLIFGAGVMVGVNLAREDKTGQKPAAPRPPAEEPPQEMLFPDVLEGHKAPEQLTVQAPATQPEPTQPRPAKAAEKKPAVERTQAADKAAPSPATVATVKEPAVPAAEGPAGTGELVLQVAAYRESEPAERLAEKLRAAGFTPVEAVKSDVPGKGLYFRVRLGRYAGRDQADADRQRLAREMALDALIVRRE